MADKQRFLDVWILETNTVYREVPFTVVTDWVQQGRLLGDDMLRWSGQAEWFRLGEKAAFNVYLPKSEAQRVDDQAEALEPVQGEVVWRHRHQEEDDDVDMIPLIDISLVLLIFFIMTTAGAAGGITINTPESYWANTKDDTKMMWVGLDRNSRGNVVYSLGYGESAPRGPEDQNLQSLAQLMERLDVHLSENQDPVEVAIKADRDLEAGLVRKLQIELDKRRPKIVKKYTVVSEKRMP